MQHLSDPPRIFNAASYFIDRHLPEGRAARPAIRDARGEHSYADLVARVNRAGNLLKAQGVEPENRVMITLHDGIDFVAFFWGAVKIGAVPVPINTLLTTGDYQFMLQDSRARVLVVQDALLERFRPIIGACPQLAHVLISGKAPPSATSLDALLADHADTLDPVETVVDDIAFWLYTSGSTGQPKGAMHTHGDLYYTAELYGRRHLGLTENDRVFSAAKLFFAYGLGNAMSFPLAVGASVDLLADRPTPAAVMDKLCRGGITAFFGVPTLYAAILGDPEQVGRKIDGALRLCVSAGEALPPDVFHRWQDRFGLEILDGLGSTEMLHIFLSNQAGQCRPGTSGRPVEGYDAKIVGEDDETLHTGEVGELLVRGPSAAVAYWNNRAKSRATFLGDWVRTGDKYMRDADGFYHYRGRSDDMLKVGGIWVSPFEVESSLISHPAVLEAAVIGVEDDDKLIKPKAYIVLKSGEADDEAQAARLKEHVKNQLAPYKYPRWILFVEELPKTATGKIQRFRLRQLEH